MNVASLVRAGQAKYQPFSSCRTPTGCLRKRRIQGNPGLEPNVINLRKNTLKTKKAIGNIKERITLKLPHNK